MVPQQVWAVAPGLALSVVGAGMMGVIKGAMWCGRV